MKRFFKILLYILLTIVFAYIWIGVQIATYKPTFHSGPCDCAIVLGAGVMNEKPSPVFQGRLEHALDLYQSGHVKKIVTTGGIGRGDILSEGKAGSIFLTSKGVIAEDVKQEKRSTTTIGNLRGAKAIMEKEGYQTAVLISDPYHLRRAEMIAKSYGIDVYTSPTPFTRYQSLKTKLPFLLSEITFTIECRVWLLRR